MTNIRSEITIWKPILHIIYYIYNLSIAQMFTDVFILLTRHYLNLLHVIVCRFIRSFPVTTKSTQWVWSVSRGCYHLYGTWPYLFFFIVSSFISSCFVLSLEISILNTVRYYHRSCIFLIDACFQTKYKYYKDLCISIRWCKKNSCCLNTSDFKAMRWSWFILGKVKSRDLLEIIYINNCHSKVKK